MMKFKKFLAAAMTGAMMLGVAAAAAPTVSAYAEDTSDNQDTAAAKSIYTVDIDYAAFTATVSAPTLQDTFIILDVLKDETGEKVTATYSYWVGGLSPAVTDEAGETVTPATYGAVVDLSFLKATKDAYIRVRGNSETAASDIIKVNAQPTKSTIKYKYAGGSFSESFTIKKDGTTYTGADAATLFAKYEYRTLYGSVFNKWDENIITSQMSYAGTTLVIREAASETAPAGAEVKLKIAAAPKAPKVTVDYVNGVIKLPKGTAYYVISGADMYNVVEVGDSAVQLTPLEILEASIPAGDTAEATRTALLENGFTIAVCTPGSATKLQSNLTFVDVPAARTITDDGKGTISAAEGTLTYTFDENGTTLTAAGASFLYSTNGGIKWFTLKANAKKVIKAATAKEILVKAAGDKTSEIWASADSVTITHVVPADDNDTTVTVDTVTVTVGDGSGSVVYSAGTVNCTAVVTGSEGVAQTVTWSVAGKDGVEIASTIDAETGVLTVATGDITKILVITATSTVDAAKSGTAEVAVSAQ